MTRTVDDVGTLNHVRSFEAGSLQLIVILETDLPPILIPTAQKYGRVCHKIFDASPIEKIEDKGLNSGGDVNILRL